MTVIFAKGSMADVIPSMDLVHWYLADLGGRGHHQRPDQIQSFDF